MEVSMNASSANFKEYMDDQIEEINKYKWIRGEQLGYDPGQEAVKEWISKYSQIFRENWEEKHN